MNVSTTTFHRFTRWELFQFMFEALSFIEERTNDMPETFKSKAKELRDVFDIYDIEVANHRRHSAKQLKEVEELRDYAIRKIYEVIRTYSNYTFAPEKEIAAKGLLFVFKRYGSGRNISRSDQDTQTAMLKNLLQELARPDAVQHLSTLHLTDAVAALTTHNEVFEREQRIRNKANAHYVTEVAKNARLNVQNEFVAFVEVLNALAILEGPEKYAQLKLNLNQVLKHYVALVRKRTKKKGEEEEE